MSKAVAVKEDNAAVAAWGDSPLPTGFEGARPQDFVIPYFSILQGLSPQVETVDGAKPGIIINTTTEQLYKDGFNFVGVKYTHMYVRWKPNRGGFVAAYPDEPIMAEARDEKGKIMKGPDGKPVMEQVGTRPHEFVRGLLAKVNNDLYAKLITDDGDEVQETYYVTGIAVNDDLKMTGLGQIAFKSTAIKKYKAWRTTQANFFGEHNIRAFQMAWHLSTLKEKNSKGEFYNWKFAPAKTPISAAVITDADAVKSIMELLKSEVAINYEGEARSQANEGGDEAM